MRLPTAAAPAVWIATRTVLLLLVFHVLPFPGPDVTSDVSVIYQGWFDVLRTGSFPQGDVTWQYPPLAAAAVLAPGALPFLGYSAAFFVVVCVADAVVFAQLLAAGRGRGRRRAGAWCWVVGLPLLGPTAYARYDVVVAAVAVAALLLLVRRPAVGGALAGLGALLKVWPALLLLGTPRGRGTRVAWCAAGIAAAGAATAFTLRMPGAFDFLTAQRDRGTEVESLGALVFHLARHAGWEGQVLLHYGSVEFLGPYVEFVSAAALVLTAAAFAWLLVWRVRAREWTASTPADAAFTALLLFVTTSRVISPQYMVWLVAVAAVCLCLRASRMGPPAVMVVAATAVTMLEFPIWFGEVVASSWLGLSLLVVRNGLLVAACLSAGRRLWRTTVTEPREAGARARAAAADLERVPARHGPRTAVAFPATGTAAAAERNATGG
ncbi:glycosyltransferase 87 family protein [Streptomyces sp. TR06-5]|uniref:glycosyltransferase 87 family protein n=1 Tax=unclassified Streptomyces TaxID=2593676 RepID=UPI00399EF23D